MSEVVLRHPDLPNQPMIVPVGPSGVVSADWAKAGWEIDADADPVRARLELPELSATEPVAPHFAAAETPPVGDPVDYAQTQPAPAPVEEPSSEQGEDTTLNLSKE